MNQSVAVGAEGGEVGHVVVVVVEIHMMHLQLSPVLGDESTART
jgi:hypothetical protein